MSRLLPIIASLLIALPALAGAAIAKPVRIGVSLPLGSSSAKLSEQYLVGMRLAIHNESQPGQFELLPMDDGCDREIGALAAEDFAESNVAMVTGYFCSEPAEISATYLKDSGIPIIVTEARSVRLMIDRKKEEWNLWRMAPGDDFPAEAAFIALSKRWQNIPYALLDDGTIYGRTLVDEFRARMEEANLKPQFVDNFRAAQSTQASLIRRLRNSGVQAAFIGASADDISIISHNIAELSGKFDIVGGEVMNILPYQIDGKPLPKGLLAIMEPEPDQLASTKSLREQLASENIDPEPFVFKGYAAMQVVMQAIKDTPENTTKALQSQTFNTVLGDVKFNADGINTHNHFVLQRWNGKIFEPVNSANDN